MHTNCMKKRVESISLQAGSNRDPEHSVYKQSFFLYSYFSKPGIILFFEALFHT